MRSVVCAAVLLLGACGQGAPRAKAPEAPAAEDAAAAVVAWDTRLLELMPQIDACIALAPEARYVTYAGVIEGISMVRLRSANGGVDCTVGATGAAQIAPRDDTLHIAAENTAIFVRAPGENPGGECFEAPEVRSADGELLGWMDDPEGC